MTAQKGLDTHILIDGYNLTTKASNVQAVFAFDEAEESGYSQHHSQIKGQASGQMTLDGYFDKTTASIHTILSQLLDDTEMSLLLGNNATPTLGDAVLSMQANQSNYDILPNLAEIIAVNAIFNQKGGSSFNVGKLLKFGTETATGNGSSLDNSASTANGAVGYCHLYGVSASDTITVKIQDSANDSTWADLITFTLDGSAVGSERIAVTGTIDRYVRAIWTIGGTAPSFDLAVSLARLQAANL